MERVVSTFRNELNDCLPREEWNDAVIFQHGSMIVLSLFERDQTNFPRCKATTSFAIG